MCVCESEFEFTDFADFREFLQAVMWCQREKRPTFFPFMTSQQVRAAKGGSSSSYIFAIFFRKKIDNHEMKDSG